MNEIFDEDRFYHISNVKIENHFYPKIPNERLFNEDETTRRICVSDSLFGTFSAYPYLQHLVDNINRSERDGTLALLYVFSTPKKEIPAGIVIPPKTLIKEYHVSDADLTGEHWIIDTEMSFESVRSFIVKEIDYETFLVDFLSFTRVKSLEIEFSCESFEREFEYAFFGYDDQSDVQKVKELLHEDWVISESVDPKDNFITLHFKIPAGIDMTEIWSRYHSIREDYAYVTRRWLPKPKCLTAHCMRTIENPISLFEEC